MAPTHGEIECLWSPTGEHTYLNVRQMHRDRVVSVDRCRYCGSPAFEEPSYERLRWG
jgi:hypothetical protein